MQTKYQKEKFMAYNDKCNFVNLSKDPLKPPAKSGKSAKRFMAKSKELTKWRNGWFKGQYEKSTKLL